MAAVIGQLPARRPVASMELKPNVDETINVGISGFDNLDGDWTLGVQGVPWCSLHSAFATLTFLSVGESIFAVGPRLPETPALTNLVIGLLHNTSQISFGHESVFLLPRDSERRLLCPRLCTLSLSGTSTADVQSGGSGTRLAPYMVRDFIECHLHFEVPRLQQLTLKGVALVESPVDDIVSLFALVEDVQCRPARVDVSTRFSDIEHWDVL